MLRRCGSGDGPAGRERDRGGGGELPRGAASQVGRVGLDVGRVPGGGRAKAVTERRRRPRRAVEANRGRRTGAGDRPAERQLQVVHDSAGQASPLPEPSSRNVSRSRPKPCAVGSFGDSVTGSRKSSSGVTARSVDRRQADAGGVTDSHPGKEGAGVAVGLRLDDDRGVPVGSLRRSAGVGPIRPGRRARTRARRRRRTRQGRNARAVPEPGPRNRTRCRRPAGSRRYSPRPESGR